MDSSLIEPARLQLDVHGVRVLVSAAHPAHVRVLEKLGEDFAFFSRPVDDPEIRLELREGVAPADVGGPILFSTRMCTVRGAGRRRFCDYGRGLGILALNQGDRRSLVLSDASPGDNEALAYEISYTTLLSAIGEALDLKGYHRVHALGFEREEQGWLVVLPSGGGKSTTCARLLRDPAVRILSDEMPLIRDGVAYPFPVRMALRPEDAAKLFPEGGGRLFERKIYPAKLLFPIPSERIAGPVRISRVVLERPRLIRWFSSVVAGLGLAQMSEHMLRFDSPLRLARIALRRLAAATRLAWLCLRPLPEKDAEWLGSVFRPRPRR